MRATAEGSIFEYKTVNAKIVEITDYFIVHILNGVNKRAAT